MTTARIDRFFTAALCERKGAILSRRVAYTRALTMSDHSDMAEVLGALAAQAPDRPALTAPGRASLSFGALVAQQRRTTAQLRDLGLLRGDLVAWCNVDRAQTAAAIATLPDGCTAAPLSASVTRDG